MEHASPLEFIYASVAAVAWCLSLYSWWEANVDSTIQLVARIIGPRRMIADENIRQEALRLVQTSLLLIGGVLSLLMSPPPPPYDTLPQSVILLTILTIHSALMIASSLFDRMMRHRIQDSTAIEVATESRKVHPPAGAGRAGSNATVLEVARQVHEEHDEHRRAEIAAGVDVIVRQTAEDAAAVSQAAQPATIDEPTAHSEPPPIVPLT